jgi:hypothetical protein
VFTRARKMNSYNSLCQINIVNTLMPCLPNIHFNISLSIPPYPQSDLFLSGYRFRILYAYLLHASLIYTYRILTVYRGRANRRIVVGSTGTYILTYCTSAKQNFPVTFTPLPPNSCHATHTFCKEPLSVLMSVLRCHSTGKHGNANSYRYPKPKK